MSTRRSVLMLSATLALTACGSSVRMEPATNAPRPFTSNEISVTTRGSGPDVILIHGLAGHTGVWDVSAEALDDRYRLHLVQIHGFGGVPRASGDSLVSTAVAREVARYIRETGLTRPALVGHSMGGTIAMMVAARNPGLAGRLMVVDMVPFMGAMFGQPDAAAEALRPIADQVRAQLREGDMLSRMIASGTRSADHREKLLQYANASDRATVAHALHELILTDMRPELSRIEVPLTVLYVQDANVPLSAEQFDSAMQQLYSRARGATLVRVADSNHYIQLDRPDRFVAAVDALMSR